MEYTDGSRIHSDMCRWRFPATTTAIATPLPNMLHHRPRRHCGTSSSKRHVSTPMMFLAILIVDRTTPTPGIASASEQAQSYKHIGLATFVFVFTNSKPRPRLRFMRLHSHTNGGEFTRSAQQVKTTIRMIRFSFFGFLVLVLVWQQFDFHTRVFGFVFGVWSVRADTFALPTRPARK